VERKKQREREKRHLIVGTAVGLALVGLFGVPECALAHDMEIDYVLGEKGLRIEVWFSFLNEENPARGAKIEVKGAGDAVLLSGETDHGGGFIFQPDSQWRGDLVVTAKKAGHGARCTIPEAEWRALLKKTRGAPGTGDGSETGAATGRAPESESFMGRRGEKRHRGIAVNDVLAMIALILGAGALIHTWLQGRRLKRIEKTFRRKGTVEGDGAEDAR
jgi:hypothetical protein